MVEVLRRLTMWSPMPSRELRRALHGHPRLRYAWRCMRFTLGYVLFLILITTPFVLLKDAWRWYAVIVGIVFGLTAGVIVLTKVARSIQIAAFGAITGIGVDSLFNSNHYTEGSQEVAATTSSAISGYPTNVVERLASVISNIIEAVKFGSKRADVALPLTDHDLTIGLWVSLLVLGLMLLFGWVSDKEMQPGMVHEVP